MAIDSSSGTLPSSSRLTIDSSSAIARSNGICSISPFSLLSFCAIAESPEWNNVARIAPRAIRGIPLPDSRSLIRASRKLSPHQCQHVGGGGIAQGLQVVAAFEQRHDASAGVAVGDVHELLRHPGEVALIEIDV